jgi:ribonuclease BN (tRNA processing enzyme)
MNPSHVTILGARGSVPVSAPVFARYGGATSCVLVQMAGTNIVLDAGTGLLRLPADVLAVSGLSLLLTHAHLDHLNGIPMCPYVMSGGRTLDIYAAKQEGRPVSEVLEALYAPPIWPVRPSQLAVEIRYHDVEPEFRIGNVTVRSMDGVHPGGVKLFRLSADGKSVVFATDCTMTESLYPKAVAFAEGCDLLLCDGQYSDEEFIPRAGFGHTTWKTAARLGKDCGAAVMRVIHHDPTHTDEILDAAAAEIHVLNSKAEFAREGETISL